MLVSMEKILESMIVEEPGPEVVAELESGPEVVTELVSPQEEISSRPTKVEELHAETLVDLPAEPIMELYHLLQL